MTPPDPDLNTPRPAPGMPRLVIAAAQSRTPAPSASVRVLQGYVLRQQTQDRWGK